MRTQIFAAIVFAAIVFAAMAANGQSYVPEYGALSMKVASVAPVAAYPFSVRDVRLLDGPFREAMEADARYLLVIEPDRLLSEFRAHAGLKPKAEKYGGWGVIWSGRAHVGALSVGLFDGICGDGGYAVQGPGRYIVGELALCQKARGSGYIGAIPREDTLWSEVGAGKIRSAWV